MHGKLRKTLVRFGSAEIGLSVFPPQQIDFYSVAPTAAACITIDAAAALRHAIAFL